MNVTEVNKQITKNDLDRVFWRLHLLQITNNFESMQAIGFLSTFVPVLERLYGDEPEEVRIEAMKRHLQFYNSHLNSNALILGITAAIEETTGEDEKEAVTSIKTGLMGPLAGVGDSVLKFTVLPIFGSIGAALAFSGSIMGPILMFVLYNIISMGTKYYGIHYGYSKGMDLISQSGNDILNRVWNFSNIVGLMVIGSLTASIVKVNTVFEFGVGDNEIIIQELFDKVMPGLLSILVTTIIYFILKKTNGKHTSKIIFLIMALSILFTYFGVLG